LLDFPWKEVEMSGASPELETAHDLFVDIVGYSRHTLPDQLRLQDGLQQALRDSAEFLQDLDYFEIKHGERLRVFSLVRDGLGTRAKPEKMIQTRVVLLNKRNAQPDDEILKLLVTQLRANGCYVFLDRHLKVGVEWAKEIERQIRSADVVIPLLSAGSMYSEMLAYEVEEAHKAFQAQGTPRLLPVRVAYTGPLSEEIAGVLDPVRQFLWETPGDDARLVSELLDAIQNPDASAPTLPLEKLEPVGGAVALDSQFWIVRSTEAEFRAAIARNDSIVLLKGARQMGKTSLLARGLQQGRSASRPTFRNSIPPTLNP
jgi:hypothetical protein